MRELYGKYLYNGLNKFLVVAVIVNLLLSLGVGRSIAIFDYFIIFFPPISYYVTFYRNKTIEDIVPVSNKEKFKRNFTVWVLVCGIYLIVAVIYRYNYTNGDMIGLHNWFIQTSSIVCISVVVLAVSIAKRKYKSNWVTTMVVVITMLVLFGTSFSLSGYMLFDKFSNLTAQIVADLFRGVTIVVALRYSFKNLNEIKF